MEPNAEQMQQAIMIGRLILAIVPITAIINVVINIINTRRKPSISEELYREYATKKDLAELRTDFNKTMNEYFSRQHMNQASIDDKFVSIMRSIGKVEGKLEKCPTICSPMNKG